MFHFMLHSSPKILIPPPLWGPDIPGLLHLLNVYVPSTAMAPSRFLNSHPQPRNLGIPIQIAVQMVTSKPMDARYPSAQPAEFSPSPGPDCQTRPPLQYTPSLLFQRPITYQAQGLTTISPSKDQALDPLGPSSPNFVRTEGSYTRSWAPHCGTRTSCSLTPHLQGPEYLA